MTISMHRHQFRFMLIGFLTLIAGSAFLPVYAEDLAAADSREWPSFGKDYGNQRFAASTQINAANVGKLKEIWHYKSGVPASFQATPIVVAGVMYLSLPYDHVVALDAKTGRELWRYEHKRRSGWKMCCGPANRGVAVANGRVFIGTVDARLVALDAKTGDVVWDIDAVDDTVASEGQDDLNSNDPNSRAKVSGGTGIGIAMAPIVYKGKVIIGITGVGYGLHIENPREDAPLGAVIGVSGRYGRPGFLAAFDVETGARVWQFDTISQQEWTGNFSTRTADGAQFKRDVATEKKEAEKYPDAWRYGGGSAWSTPALDPQLGLLYFGTGNPSPQMNDVERPGDNLYTVSLVALDAETGKLKWHYQQVPHDLWGYDLASPPVLFTLQRDGKSIPAVGQAGKTGWFYVHDRRTGRFLFKSEAFVPHKNMFEKATALGVTLYPGILGGANWSPVALDEQAQFVYVAGIHAPITYTLHETPAKDGKPAIRYASSEPAEEPRWGLLSAIDLKSGHIRWQQKMPQPLIGGVLATAGGIVFTGEGNGNFDAYDASNGELLWQAKADAGVNAPPISYEVDGVQYIAVAAGGNAIFGYKQGDSLIVYALPE